MVGTSVGGGRWWSAPSETGRDERERGGKHSGTVGWARARVVRSRSLRSLHNHPHAHLVGGAGAVKGIDLRAEHTSSLSLGANDLAIHSNVDT